jgi:hypothetical protein
MKDIRTLGISLLGSVGLCMMVTGCAAEKHEAIPASAQLTAKGEKELTYRATTDGRAYVYDRSTGDMLYTGNLRRGEVISVDAMKDKIYVDNTPIDKKIRDHDEIKIYFEESPAARYDAVPASSSSSTIIREREVSPRSDVRTSPDGTITVQPSGAQDSKVTIEQPNSDSKVTVESGR